MHFQNMLCCKNKISTEMVLCICYTIVYQLLWIFETRS